MAELFLWGRLRSKHLRGTNLLQAIFKWKAWDFAMLLYLWGNFVRLLENLCKSTHDSFNGMLFLYVLKVGLNEKVLCYITQKSARTNRHPLVDDNWHLPFFFWNKFLYTTICSWIISLLWKENYIILQFNVISIEKMQVLFLDLIIMHGQCKSFLHHQLIINCQITKYWFL